MRELQNAAGFGFDDGFELPRWGEVFLLTVIFPLKVKMPFSGRLAYVLLRFLRTRFTITVTPPITASTF